MLLHNPFGPIFSRELRAISRRRRSYLLRVVFLAGLLLILIMAYSGTDLTRGGGGVLWRVQRLGELGQIFFICFAMFSAAVMAMVGPVLTCTAVSAERLHKTLPVLLMTPISAWQIVTGKLFSRLLIALTLLGLSLPVLAVVRLLGGVELEQMFAALALCASIALLGASLGLLISTFVNRAYLAILFAYGALLALWVLTPILIAAPYMNSPAPGRWTLHAMTTVSPLLSVAFLVLPGGMLPTAPWGWCVATQTSLAAGLVVCCALALRRIQRREGSPATSAVDIGAMTEPVADPAPGESPAAQRRALARGEVGDNPVLWRELKRPLFAKRWQSLLAFTGFIAVLLGSYGLFALGGELSEQWVQVLYAVLLNFCAWAVFSVLAATAIAQEKESDTWTLLLATPLSGRQIILGKLLGLYRAMLWPTLIVLGHFSVFAVAGVIGWWTVLSVIWIMLTFNTVWVAVGLFLSLAMRKVTVAVIVNLMLGIGFYLVLPLLLLMATSGDKSAQYVLWCNPYYYLTEAVNLLSAGYDWSDHVSLPGYGYGPLTLFIRGLLLSGATYLLVSAAVVLMVLNRFNKIVGRADDGQ